MAVSWRILASIFLPPKWEAVLITKAWLARNALSVVSRLQYNQAQLPAQSEIVTSDKHHHMFVTFFRGFFLFFKLLFIWCHELSLLIGWEKSHDPYNYLIVSWLACIPSAYCLYCFGYMVLDMSGVNYKKKTGKNESKNPGRFCVAVFCFWTRISHLCPSVMSSVTDMTDSPNNHTPPGNACAQNTFSRSIPEWSSGGESRLGVFGFSYQIQTMYIFFCLFVCFDSPVSCKSTFRVCRGRVCKQ